MAGSAERRTLFFGNVSVTGTARFLGPLLIHQLLLSLIVDMVAGFALFLSSMFVLGVQIVIVPGGLQPG